jgi:hypothetical protein
MAIKTFSYGAIYGRSTSTTMTAEATTSSAGNIYQVTNAAKRILDPSVEPTLNATSSTYIDKTWMNRGWDYFTGRVKLTAATSPTITGSYLTVTAYGSVISVALDAQRNTVETTAIGDTWKSYTAIEMGATVTLNRYYINTDFWTEVSAGRKVALELYEDTTTTAGYWIMGCITNETLNFTTGQVDTEAITIAVDGPIARI